MSTAIDNFKGLIQSITDEIKDLPLNSELETMLNDRFPPSGDIFKSIEAACHQGIADGEMCNLEAGGIRYGRVIKPAPELNGCSVDLVHMDDVVGPYHRHPQGEIDMIMPISDDAVFDGKGAGWMVYEPDSAHKPTVTQGEALVLYLLPGGEIDFSR